MFAIPAGPPRIPSGFGTLTGESQPDRGFPWGKNRPTVTQRVIVAILVAAAASVIVALDFQRLPDRRTDFTLSWFGARAMMEGRNPYELVGPGLEYDYEYRLLYPATALVAAVPFASLSKRNASIAFVAISAFLLVYGITAGSWHRLPMLPSAAFIESVHAAQWTIVLTAALFVPWLAFLSAAKPQSALPMLAASTRRNALIAAGIGGVILVVSSFVLLPGWLDDWLPLVRSADHIRAPLMGPVGFLILPVLLRWRRWESWLVFISACLPQTFMWYSALILLAAAATYREALVLSLVSTAGFALTLFAIEMNPAGLPRIMWTIYLCTTFVPVVIAILRRPDTGELPAWLDISQNIFRPTRARPDPS